MSFSTFDRTDPEALRARLQAAGSWSKHALGQHFLVDRAVLADILSTARVQPGERVVEIGPGLGVLSEGLLTAGAKPLAFELDPHMVKVLAEDFPELEVVPGNVLETLAPHVAELGAYTVVANIPYQITTPLLRLLLEGGLQNRPQQVTLLVQREVGERLAAGPRQSGRGYLSLLTQYFAEVEYVRSVPRSAFWPQPKVESAVLQLKVRGVRALPVEQEASFLRFVRMRFTQPRKQFKNVLAGIAGVPPKEVEGLLVEVGLPLTVRAQELSQAEWVRLFEHTKIV